MKAQLTHLWCLGAVLLRCPEESQIQWVPASLALGGPDAALHVLSVSFSP